MEMEKERRHGQMTYLVVVDEDHNDSLPPHSLNSIQISQCINLIKPPIPPHTRTRPPIPNIIPLSKNLLPSRLPPLLQKLLITLGIRAEVRLPITVIARIPSSRFLHLLVVYWRSAVDSAILLRRGLVLRSPRSLSFRLLVTSRIGNDALDACCAAGIEARRR